MNCDRLCSINFLRSRQLEHPRDIPGACNLLGRTGRFSGRRTGVNEHGQLFSDELHRLRTPMRVAFQIKRLTAASGLPICQGRAWIENADAVLFEAPCKFRERTVVEHSAW